MTDIVEQLRQPYTDREDIMRSWDALRTYLLDGRTGSYARDIFEIILSNIDEEREQAADEIDRLRAEIDAAREFVKRHPSLSLIDLAEFEAFLKVPAAIRALAEKTGGDKP